MQRLHITYQNDQKLLLCILNIKSHNNHMIYIMAVIEGRSIINFRPIISANIVVKL